MIAGTLSKFSLLFSLLTICLLPPSVSAANLGSMGETYPIVEMDFMQFIKSRVQEFQQSGHWQRLQNDMRSKAEKYRDHPASVVGITKALQTKSYLFDPGIVLDHDITSSDGRLIVLAGTRVNPLMHINLSKTLVFFDADDSDQIKWAASQEKALHGRTKLILVKGSLLEQEKYFKKHIYFDQAGKLTTRFGIHHVPALVTQQGVQLRITEVKV